MTEETCSLIQQLLQDILSTTIAAEAAESATVQRGENAVDIEANDRNAALQRQLLYLFRKCQDYFVRLNWHDEVLFPHEAAQSNLRHIGDAVRSLENKDVRGALDALYLVDNNQYAFQFDDPSCGSLERGQESQKEDRRGRT